MMGIQSLQSKSGLFGVSGLFLLSYGAAVGVNALTEYLSIKKNQQLMQEGNQEAFNAYGDNEDEAYNEEPEQEPEQEVPDEEFPSGNKETPAHDAVGGGGGGKEEEEEDGQWQTVNFGNPTGELPPKKKSKTNKKRKMKTKTKRNEEEEEEEEEEVPFKPGKNIIKENFYRNPSVETHNYPKTPTPSPEPRKQTQNNGALDVRPLPNESYLDLYRRVARENERRKYESLPEARKNYKGDGTVGSRRAYNEKQSYLKNMENEPPIRYFHRNTT